MQMTPPRRKTTFQRSRGMRWTLGVWIQSLAIALLAPLATWGQTAAATESSATEPVAVDVSTDTATDDGPFVESIDIQVVNVEVFVTDRRGNRIEGLTVDDFELRVDNRPTPISNFYAVEGGVPVLAPSESVDPIDLPADQGTSLQPLATVPEDQRLHLIVYFDNLFLKPFNRNKVVRQVRSFLAQQMGPDDRVMLVSFERSLNVRHPFTSDLRAVGDALFELEELTGYAAQADSERQRVLRALRSVKTFEEAEPTVDFYAKQRFNDLNTSIDGLKEMVGSLAGLPGRKALLYVSDGLPMKAGADLFEFLDLRFTQGASGTLLASRYSARPRFQELISAANSQRVVFYTLEAIGVRSHTSISAEYAGDGGSQMEIDIARDFNNQETLQMLAADTGGLAAFNSNNIGGALERMGNDFTTYYSLGFAPASGGDGRAYRIDVRLKDKRGLRVRHRASYRKQSAENLLLQRVQASLHHGWESNPLQASFTLGARRPQVGGNTLVPVTVTVPFRRVTLLPQEAMHRGRLRLVVAVIDEDGNLSTPEVQSLPLDIPAAHLEAVLQQDVVYTAEVALRPGPHVLAVGLRDTLSGQVTVLRQVSGDG